MLCCGRWEPLFLLHDTLHIFTYREFCLFVQCLHSTVCNSRVLRPLHLLPHHNHHYYYYCHHRHVIIVICCSSSSSSSWPIAVMYCSWWCSCRGTKTSCVNSDVGCRFHGMRAELQRHIDYCHYSDAGLVLLPSTLSLSLSLPYKTCEIDGDSRQDLLSKLAQT